MTDANRSWNTKTLTESNQIQAGPLTCVNRQERILSPEEIVHFNTGNPRFKKILFIAPQPHGYAVPHSPTPTFGYLGQLLSQHGFEWQLIDLRLGGSISDVKQKIKQFSPDVIGYTFQFTIGADFCVKFLHKIASSADLPIIIGGAHLTIRGFNILSDVPPVFAAVRKEGEYPLLALMKGVPVENIPNLWVREGDRVIENKALSFITELDDLPWPKYPGFEFKKYAYKNSIDILTSRGCPFKCAFCSVALTQGRKFRQRSPHNVMEEILYWYVQGIREFNFIDDTLTANQKRFERILDLIASRKLQDVTFSCTQGMRADVCSERLLLKMKNVGFKFLAFGVESAADRILGILHKGETFSQIDHAIEMATRLGFDVGLFFIIGSPTETINDVKKSFRFALKYPITFLNFHVCLPYPGTELAQWVDQNSNWYVNPKKYLNNFSYYDGVIAFDNQGMSRQDQHLMLKESIRINCLVRRRNAIKRMSQARIPLTISRPISYILYNPVFFHRMRTLARSKVGVPLRDLVIRLLHL